jgi:hypothetical protein
LLASTGESKGTGFVARDRDGPGSGFDHVNEVLQRFAWRKWLDIFRSFRPIPPNNSIAVVP